jgi:hypothetical protein
MIHDDDHDDVTWMKSCAMENKRTRTNCMRAQLEAKVASYAALV